MDYDNDGWPDIVQINGTSIPRSTVQFGETFKKPRLVYKNLGNGRFKDVSQGWGRASRSVTRAAARPLATMTMTADMDMLDPEHE